VKVLITSSTTFPGTTSSSRQVSAPPYHGDFLSRTKKIVLIRKHYEHVQTQNRYPTLHFSHGWNTASEWPTEDYVVRQGLGMRVTISLPWLIPERVYLPVIQFLLTLRSGGTPLPPSIAQHCHAPLPHFATLLRRFIL
jgi:hypothetical protein